MRFQPGFLLINLPPSYHAVGGKETNRLAPFSLSMCTYIYIRVSLLSLLFRFDSSFPFLSFAKRCVVISLLTGENRFPRRKGKDTEGKSADLIFRPTEEASCSLDTGNVQRSISFAVPISINRDVFRCYAFYDRFLSSRFRCNASRYPLTGANELDVVRRQRRVNGIAGRENSSGKHEGFLCSIYGGKKKKF